MARIVRAALVVLVLVVAFPGATAGVEPPTLGGRLAPVPLIAEDNPEAVTVWNLSNIPVTVTVAADDPSWRLGESTFRLEPEERRDVPLLAAGDADTRIVALMAPAEALSAPDVNALRMETTARHLRPWERLDVPLWPLLALLAVILLVVLRRLRHAR